MNHQVEKPQGSYISYFSNLVKANGGINLAQGIPGFQPPIELLTYLAEILNQNVHQYAPGIGNFNLITTIHRHYSAKYDLERDNFLIVQGATEALSLIFIYLQKLIGKPFGVLSFNPAYESYSQLPAIFGQHYIDFPLNENFTFSIDELENSIRNNGVKLIFISSPGNPFGKIWSKSEVDQLVELAVRYDAYLVFDAVYSELYFSNPPYLPLEIRSPNIFYVNSFSKMFSITGWRIGYLYSHEVHRMGIRAVHDYTGLCAPSVMQEALFRFLSACNYGQSYLEQFRGNVLANFTTLSKCLSQLNFYLPPIHGGCFIWAKLPEEHTEGFEFALNLYKSAGVAVIPGEHFSSKHTNWVRLNLARPQQEIGQAIDLLTRFIKKN